MPPSYGGFFADWDATLDIEVFGATITAEFELALHFALDDCQGGGVDGGTCTLVATGFDVDIHDIDVSGGSIDYNLTATIELNEAALAEVEFDECAGNTCEGSFSFSAAENPLSFNLFWIQVNTSTQSTGFGALHLSNDGDSIGGSDTVWGSLVLDPTCTVPI